VGGDSGNWFGGSGRKGLTRAGVPQQCNPQSGERRWGLGGAVVGTGKVVEGAHVIGGELGVVSRGSERGQSGCSWWLSDSEQSEVWGDAG
jgi:hypothetical protein